MKILILNFKNTRIKEKQVIFPFMPITLAKNKRGGIMLKYPVCPYFLALETNSSLL